MTYIVSGGALNYTHSHIHSLTPASDSEKSLKICQHLMKL